MSYIGNEPIVSATRTVTEVTATAGQTSFTPNGGYTVGFLDVFINGSKLTNTDFTATNGTTVTLTEAAQAGDIVRLEALGTFLTSSGLTANNPSYTGTLTGGTGVVNIGSGQIYKDASGNVGIGTSSPVERLDVLGNIRLGNSNPFIRLRTSTNWDYYLRGVGDNFQLYDPDNRMFLEAVYAGGGTNKYLDINGSARATANGLFAFNSGYGSVATAYGCRAWVNFNGTGTVAIRASGNVSSITDRGVGEFTVNLTSAMPDTNYAVVGTSRGGDSSDSSMEVVGVSNGIAPTVSAVAISVSWYTSFYDTPMVSVAIFR